MKPVASRRARLFLALVVAGGLIAGCGIGAESRAELLKRQAVPFGLLAPASSSTSAPSGKTPSLVTIYLQAGTRLVPASRQVPIPVTIDEALNELSHGPTAEESTFGIGSPVAAATPLDLKGEKDGVVSISVSPAFANMGGQDQIVAVAQIVFTVSSFPGVTGVLLLVGKQATQVPTGSGSLVQRPLTRSDYADLAPI